MMKIIFSIVCILLCFSLYSKAQETTLQASFKNDFLMGVALKEAYFSKGKNPNTVLVTREFNSIVAENCMKIEKIQPKLGEFDFKAADSFVAFGTAQNMFIVGHTLVWHSQCPDWMFLDVTGNDVSREILIERMKKHIYTVVGRYKGKVQGWDVVNEAIGDDGKMRPSKWYQIIGEDYIELAFKFAHEADPEAELYYNDYNMADPLKRKLALQIIRSLKEKNIRIDGIGMQAHFTMDYPEFSEVEKSIVAFNHAGVQVMLTELDITVLPFPSDKITAEISQNFEMKKEYNPYSEALSKETNKALTSRYTSLFKLLLKHKNEISRVTIWGVNDADSWRNNWPIKGRSDYPLLFDRALHPKDAYKAIIKLKENQNSN